MATAERDHTPPGTRPWFVSRDLAGLAIISVAAVSAITVLSFLPHHEPRTAPVSVTVPDATAPAADTPEPTPAPVALALPADAVPRSPAAGSPASVTVTALTLGVRGHSGTITGLTPDGTAVGHLTEDDNLGGRAVRWDVAASTGAPASVRPVDLARGAAWDDPLTNTNGVVAWTAAVKDKPLGHPVATVRGRLKTTDQVPFGRAISMNTRGEVLLDQYTIPAAGMQGFRGGMQAQAGYVWTPATGVLARISEPGAKMLDDGSVLIEHPEQIPGQTRASLVWHDETTTALPEPTGWTARVSGGHGFRALGGTLIRGTSGNPETDPADAVLWHYGRVEMLPGLGGRAATATDTNADGVVVGAAQVPSGQPRAMRWIAGKGTDLGTLGGERSWATDVSDSGVVAGWSTTPDGVQHAAAWLPDGRIVDLGAALGRATESSAQGVSGTRIWGSRTGPDGKLIPVVWTLSKPGRSPAETGSPLGRN